MMLVASFKYSIGKAMIHITPPKGRRMWIIKLWVQKTAEKVEVEIEPKKPVRYEDIHELFIDQIDELIEENPEGIDMGWDAYLLPKKRK